VCLGGCRFRGAPSAQWSEERAGIAHGSILGHKLRSAILSSASLGGLAAAYAALRHPEAIGRVLSQPGSFWWGKTDSEREWLTAEFKSRPKVNVKLYLDVGLMETTGGAISQIETNRKLRDVPRVKGYETIYGEFNGTHAHSCWRAGLADALRALLSD
jgi:enterochelin esterase-like enzyme